MPEPVDVSGLLELRQLQQPGKPDVVARIVNRFLEESAERLTLLQAATQTHDGEQMHRAAHALKGIAGTVGANEVFDLAVRLEEIGREGRTRDGAQLVSELELALGRARVIFERALL